jgi:hypothetical protein
MTDLPKESDPDELSKKKQNDEYLAWFEREQNREEDDFMSPRNRETRKFIEDKRASRGALRGSPPHTPESKLGVFFGGLFGTLAAVGVLLVLMWR